MYPVEINDKGESYRIYQINNKEEYPSPFAILDEHTEKVWTL